MIREAWAQGADRSWTPMVWEGDKGRRMGLGWGPPGDPCFPPVSRTFVPFSSLSLSSPLGLSWGRGFPWCWYTPGLVAASEFRGETRLFLNALDYWGKSLANIL